jgi:hypothetical protein
MSDDFPRLRITGGPWPTTLSLSLDGMNLADNCTELHLDIKQDNLATVTLTLEVEVDIDADVVAKVEAIKWADLVAIEADYATKLEKIRAQYEAKAAAS